MDQKTIMAGLVKALQNGDGDLSDLEQLLDRAKADIATAKKEAEEKAKRDAEQNKRKRAEGIAEMATRVLNDEVTAEDVAMVMESYLRGQGMDIHVTAEAVTEGTKHANDFGKHMNDLLEELADLFDIDELKPNKTKKPVEKNADAALDNFLKGLGLR